MTVGKFIKTKELRKTRTGKKLTEITYLSLLTIHVTIRKVETALGETVFENLYSKPGREPQNKENLHIETK